MGKRTVLYVGMIFLLASSVGYAADNARLKQEGVRKSAKESLAQAKQKVVQEAADAVKSTYQAIGLIKKGDTEKSKTALLSAAKNLEKVTAKDGDLLPIDVYVNIASGVDTPGAAKELIRQVKEAMDENDPQLARELLIPLVSEIDVSVVNIPLALYKDYLDKAVIALDEQDSAKAESFILTAIKSFVTDTEVMPLPTLVAKILLDQANSVVDDNPQAALELVHDAQVQLELNSLLGYSQSKAYRAEAGSIKQRALSVRYENVQKEIVQKIKTMEKTLSRDTSVISRKIKDEMEKIKGYFS